MKKIGLILLFATLISTISFGQKDAIASFFSNYMEDERFSTVFVSPKMFTLVSKVTPEDMDADVKKLIDNLEGLRILSTDGVDGMSFYKEAKRKIDTKGYKELMVVRDGGEEVLFLVKESGDIIRELLMISGSSTDFNMISFIGDIDLNVIARLSKDIEIDGMENFEKVKDKRNK